MNPRTPLTCSPAASFAGTPEPPPSPPRVAAAPPPLVLHPGVNPCATASPGRPASPPQHPHRPTLTLGEPNAGATTCSSGFCRERERGHRGGRENRERRSADRRLPLNASVPARARRLRVGFSAAGPPRCGSSPLSPGPAIFTHFGK